MKKILLLFCSLFSIYNYAQGCVDRIVCSEDMATVYLLDGTSLTWGKNEYGQLGNGTTVLQSTPVTTVNEGNWLNVNHARMHTVALRQNGTAWAWGNNAVGQLGTGNTVDSAVPVQVGTSSDWAVLSPGNLHTVGLKMNGTLWGWGNTGAFELTNGPAPFYHVTPIQLGTDTDWHEIHAGYFKTFAIKNNGTLWGRGRNNFGDLGTGNTLSIYNNLIQIGTDSDWLKVSAARQSFTLALKTNGTLWAWGDNEYGRLGDGTTTNRYSPVQIGTSTWKEIAAGTFHSIGIKSDGTLWQWGSYCSELINGVFGPIVPESTIPVQVGTDTDWKTIAAGRCKSYAVKENNTLYAWGYNGGFLGDGTSISRANPILITCNQLSNFNVEETAITFYPNPVKEELNINDISNIKSYEITNMLGQKVNGGTPKSKIDVSWLSKGIYMVRLYKDSGQVIVLKFIKE